MVGREKVLVGDLRGALSESMVRERVDYMNALGSKSHGPLTVMRLSATVRLFENETVRAFVRTALSTAAYVGFDEWGSPLDPQLEWGSRWKRKAAGRSFTDVLTAARLGGFKLPVFWDCYCKAKFGNGSIEPASCKHVPRQVCSLTMRNGVAYALKSGEATATGLMPVAYCHLQCGKYPSISNFRDKFMSLNPARMRRFVQRVVEAPHICLEAERGIWIPKQDSCDSQNQMAGADVTPRKRRHRYRPTRHSPTTLHDQ